MSLLSYAQNGEDVVLYRALKEIKAGHYIDIGACDPTEFSVTRIFYDLGWSGVNVEPSREHFDRLEADRKNDLNLNVAVAARPGILRFHHIRGTGLSTIIDDVASVARDKGFESESVDVPVLTLRDIYRDLPFSTTHFLKIDVEGGERDVLQGADFTTFRPWIIVVEATAPLSTQRTDGDWRGILESSDYDCVLFDGLNLFFLAREHGELRDRLAAPANVLDDYVSARFLASRKAEHDAIDAEHARFKALSEAALEAERTRAEAIQAQCDRLLEAEQARSVTALEAERGRTEAIQTQCDRLNERVRQLTDEGHDARVTLRVVKEFHDRELTHLRREGLLAAEAHSTELVNVRNELAHFKSLGERLRQILDLTGGGMHLEDRGAQLLELRANLLRQANAWQEEVELLHERLNETTVQSDLLLASTSWRVTSPLRGLRRATYVLRREPHRLPGLIQRRARSMLGRPTGSDMPMDVVADSAKAPRFDAGAHALITVAARLDVELALMADLLESVSSVLIDDASAAAGPCYDQGRLEERLTRWILIDVARQRRSGL